jgi:UDP-N-acetylmuramate dehydrogenase
MAALADPMIIEHAPIPTWFGIGGGADRFCRPESLEQLKQCIQLDPNLKILGDGANLLVDDDGVGDLIASLTSPTFSTVKCDKGSNLVIAGAGANLPKMITESVRLGLGGIEGLAGIPATIGGAVRMNAGGAFGQIADTVVRVHGLDRQGHEKTIERDDIPFSYRHSGLEDLIITSVELELHDEDPKALRERLKEVMEYKKKSQPMADRSAGCVFKNAMLHEDLKDIALKGERISAGMLIDKAGCKGLALGGASVSHRHGNFIVTDPKTAKARHVIDLMADVTRRVHAHFGVTLIPEVVIWSRSSS